ncbi:iduronate 2-sulfatase-like [Haliotis asinina]|uniref:iduronate 2-sulfatase-like n=1 Tax=Haliotis asinina TaxID=109174 RepID=UPI003531BAB2
MNPAALVLTFSCLALAGGNKNVLFLIVDDLRPQLGCYEDQHFPSPTHPKMHTPNLDALAKKSLLLTRGYCQYALCGPSRASVLTGRRPDSTHVYNLRQYWREVGGNFTTIPQYFKEHGYNTVGMGKIFHPGASSGDKDPVSWSDGKPNVDFQGDRQPYLDYTLVKAITESELLQNPLSETMLANHAIDTVKHVSHKAKSGQQNFFVAVGFHKPHIPWHCPAKYLNYYPTHSVKPPSNMYPPKNMPLVAWHYYKGLGNYDDVKELNLTDIGNVGFHFPNDTVVKLRQAYYACVSWIDDEIGRILKTLEDEGLADDTIVSFWGDHGWALGENGEWEKQTNFEIGTHVPFMVRVPGLTDHGIKTDKLTELVDLFPTLVEAAGLPKLSRCLSNEHDVKVCAEGDSMVPLMKNPNDGAWKQAVFSQYSHSLEDSGPYMGYTIKTDRYRYTEWPQFDFSLYLPDWDKQQGAELYDHLTDPWETENRANNQAYLSIRQQLSRQLRAGWRNIGTHGGPLVG